MKVWLTIDIDVYYNNYDIEVYVWQTEKEARAERARLCLQVDISQVPKDAYIDAPIKPSSYDKWYAKNGAWANRVCKKLGRTGFPPSI